jgi:hypothetical protein
VGPGYAGGTGAAWNAGHPHRAGLARPRSSGPDQARNSRITKQIGALATEQYCGRFLRIISVHSWTLVAFSTSLVGLAAITPSAARAEPHGMASALAHRVASAAVHEVSLVMPLGPAPTGLLDIDVPGLRRHVEAIAKQIGHPARALATKLGTAAKIGDGMIEWNLADVGVGAASAYGYASVVDGAVTGFVIRGRASLDKLQQLHLHRPLQLTLAGGERPSYSITAGE